MKVNTISDLRDIIAKIVKERKVKDTPLVITYSRGIEDPKYKITIEENEEDFFIDSKGTKWVKSK